MKSRTVVLLGSLVTAINLFSPDTAVAERRQDSCNPGIIYYCGNSTHCADVAATCASLYSTCGGEIYTTSECVANEICAEIGSAWKRFGCGWSPLG